MMQTGKSKSKDLWNTLESSLLDASRLSKEVVLGIKAESGETGLKTLQRWVDKLGLVRGTLRAFSEAGAEVPFDELMYEKVYIKYNSSNGGDAWMKPFAGESIGVIFQTLDNDGIFRQGGDLPLFLFDRK